VSNINPYQPPSSELSASETTSGSELELADRGTRLGAILLDSVITAIPALLLIFLFYSAFGFKFWPPTPGSQSFLFTLAASVIGILVHLAINGVLLYRYGQTVGKRICNIRIAKPNGDVPSLIDTVVKRRLLFTLLQRVPGVGLLIGLVDILMIFREDHRCLHDHVAGTIVVKS